MLTTNSRSLRDPVLAFVVCGWCPQAFVSVRWPRPLLVRPAGPAFGALACDGAAGVCPLRGARLRPVWTVEVTPSKAPVL